MAVCRKSKETQSMRKILLCAVVGLIPGFAFAAGAATPATDAKATVKTEAAVNSDAVKPAMPATVDAAKTTADSAKTATSTKAPKAVHVVHKAVNKTKPATTVAPKT